MKKLIMAMALVFGLTIPAFAGRVDQAENNMKAGMYDAACNILETEIEGNGKTRGNPLNAEAHLLLGECYLYLDPPRIVKAKERFRSAVKLNAKFAKKVAPAYRKAGEQRLNDGESEYARQMFNKAVSYQPAIADEIAYAVLAYGKKHVEDFYLSLAVQYSQGKLAKEVAEFYYDLSKNTDGEPSLIFIKQADEYSGGAYKTEVGNKALEVCDNQLRSEDRKICIDRNLEYLSTNQIFESSVRFYARLWGTPTKVVLEAEEWNEITKLNSGDIIHYLSMDEFWVKGKTSQRLWEPAISEDGQIMFMNMSEPCPASFKKKTVSAIVYVWIERK